MEEGRSRDRTHRAVAKAIEITDLQGRFIALLRELVDMATESGEGDGKERTGRTLEITIELTRLQSRHSALLQELVRIATEPDDIAALIRDVLAWAPELQAPRPKPIEVSDEELAGLIAWRSEWAAVSEDQTLDPALSPSQRFIVALIQAVARDYNNTPASAIAGKGQDMQVVAARCSAAWLLQRHTTLTTPQIAQLLQKSPGTVGDYIRRVNRERGWSKRLADRLRRLAEEARDLTRMGNDTGPDSTNWDNPVDKSRDIGDLIELICDSSEPDWWNERMKSQITTCFRREGIRKVADLLGYDKVALRDIRFFGDRCLRLVQVALASRGLRLAP